MRPWRPAPLRCAEGRRGRSAIRGGDTQGNVIPANAGIQEGTTKLDPRLPFGMRPWRPAPLRCAEGRRGRSATRGGDVKERLFAPSGNPGVEKLRLQFAGRAAEPR